MDIIAEPVKKVRSVLSEEARKKERKQSSKISYESVLERHKLAAVSRSRAASQMGPSLVYLN